MKSIKLTTLLAAFAAAFIITSHAGTYTWTGAGNDGLWTTVANWNYNGEAATSHPGSSPSDDVVINGNYNVTYDVGVDFAPQANVVITVSGGAKLTQSGGNWQNFGTGAELILDNGSYDGGTSGKFRLNNGILTIRNGGSFTCSNGELSRDDNSVVTVESGDIVLKGNFKLLASDQFVKGSITTEGELVPTANITLDGFSLSCSTMTPANNPVITLKAGSISTRRTADASDGGFWGACTVDIIIGKVASFSALVHNDKTAYADTYGTTRFKYNGSALSAEEFAQIFTTEITSDGDYSRYTISTSEVSGAPAIASYSAVYSDSAIAFEVSLEDSSAPDTVLTLYYDTADHEHNTSFGWPNSVLLVLDETDGKYKAVVNTTVNAVYYYLISASSESAAQTIWTSGTIIAADMPTDSNVWLGNTSDITLPSNWSKQAVPDADDIVEISQFFSKGERINWDVAAVPEVAGWRQSNAMVVSFNTTASSAFLISGDASLTAGTWTHGGPADEPTEMINVTVGGSMTVGSNARIVAGTGANTDDNDGAPRGYTRGHGPGYLRTAGGSYAGEGGHITNTTGFVTYGSILNPASYGSGGWGDNVRYGGGGIVKLDVGGALTMNGVIRSRGFGYALNGVDQATGEPTTGGAGSGGSINITAASISGTGSIDANGGNNGLYGPGSGGRVKVALTGNSATFDSFTGTIEAVGGWMESDASPTIFDVSPAAGGTVCLQTGNSNPVVKVYNVFRIGGNDSTWRVATGEAIPSATHLPAMQNGDTAASLKTTKWELSGRGSIRLTADVLVESLELAAAEGDQCVYAEGHTLTVRQLFINGVKLPSGTYTASNTSWVKGEGSVIASGKGLAIVIR